jgi:hypothetical protein
MPSHIYCCLAHAGPPQVPIVGMVFDAPGRRKLLGARPLLRRTGSCPA